MNKFFVLLAFIFIACFALASRNPEEWKMTRRARSDERVTFYVALKQRNVKQLEVSTTFT
jgi:hypothetical protein